MQQGTKVKKVDNCAYKSTDFSSLTYHNFALLSYKNTTKLRMSWEDLSKGKFPSRRLSNELTFFIRPIKMGKFDYKSQEKNKETLKS